MWEWDYSYELLRDGFSNSSEYDELRKLIGLYNACMGPVLGFKLFNPDDNFVERQLIGTTDGTTTTYTLTRTYGADNPNLGFNTTEPVGFVDTTQPFFLYVDASNVPKRTDDATYAYSLVTTTPVLQQLVFSSAPPAGHSLYVEMNYLYYARFKDSSQDFQKFMNKLWMLQKVTLRSLRSEAAS
jgi:hypothetical protein